MASWLPASWVWVEGEQAVKTNIGKHPWYYGQVKKAELSGGDFLAHFDQTKQGEAEYTFTIPSVGQYTLWLRANPTQATMKYSLNGSPLAPVDFANGQTSVVNIAANNAPDLRFLAWSVVGKFPLRSGTNTLRFVMDSANQNHGAIDCFVFTDEPFAPMGALKPDQLADKMKQVASNNQGWIPWNPSPDDFKPSPIDLRFLNEKFAGENGFIQARGEQFVHRAADLMVGLGDAGRVEILADLAENILVASLLEIGADHIASIGIGVRAGLAELFRGPQAEQLVAPRHRLEPQFLVVRVSVLEAFAALVECRHGFLRFRPDGVTPSRRPSGRLGH